jgi:death on curing protein
MPNSSAGWPSDSVEPRFLSREQVDELHGEALARFGGTSGVRDSGLVDSALASAQHTYFYGHGDVFDIAAAYAFHLAEAQGYLDANKRTAVLAALTFLAGNGYYRTPDQMVLYDAMIAIAEKRLNKAGLAGIFRRLAESH